MDIGFTIIATSGQFGPGSLCSYLSNLVQRHDSRTNPHTYKQCFLHCVSVMLFLHFLYFVSFPFWFFSRLFLRISSIHVFTHRIVPASAHIFFPDIHELYLVLYLSIVPFLIHSIALFSCFSYLHTPSWFCIRLILYYDSDLNILVDLNLISIISM